ncbi:uncharacterized protein LOC114530278 [Dendronephthya gigantea]|uniref:uncharacterized protein LOC114530278 n=1 Tax=Dendronephthya gigantea TaxID=151771 RepID=UPI0010692697|nr:uncharacterized protein LOC114530278 [Dendronephthya gigantea]XP_028407682.1 uncharacterized protein LOC114530278 [Dendronephthya gigantea]XP_028407683.1 uncharacterized protein LOC114530278 [Dendronephthya gigantea]
MADSRTEETSRMGINARNLFESIGVLKPGVTAFGMGAPSFEMMAKLKPLLAEATKQRLESEEYSDMFQYGALCGDYVFLQELAKFLSKRYQDPVNSHDMVCTSGATIGLMMVTLMMFQPGDYVFVEDPTYFIAIKMFRQDLGLNILAVPTDDEGVKIDALEQLILEHMDKLGETSETRPYRAMFYTVPVFNNPTSVSLPPERCSALIKVLRKYNIVAVCDDVYNIINFESKPPPRRLFSYDKKSDSDYKGHVVSNGSFSKIVAPGMRLGWLEAPKIIRDKIIFSPTLASGGGLNQYTSAIMGTALKNEILSSYFTDIISDLKRKMELMCESLDKYAKPYVKYRKPTGGYFVWVELPSNCDAEAFAKYCEEKHKVSVRPGPNFSPYGNFKNFIRLSFAFLTDEEIEKGVREIGTALTEYCSY